MAKGTRIAVLHVSPHPDDEMLGAPATLLALRDAGHRVVNLACSLGSAAEREQRGRELADALELARLEDRRMVPPLGISRGDDLDAAQRRLADELRELVAAEAFELVIAPTPHDGHQGHEVVGRAAVEALAGLRNPPRLWMWGLWADLPMPTLFVPFGDRRRDEILRALDAHAGQLARSDYAAALEGRARAVRVLGVERTFGFGEPRTGGPYAFLRDDPSPFAEVLTEVLRVGGEWHLGSARIPAFDDPLTATLPDVPVGWWLEEMSMSERRRRVAAAALRDPQGGD